mmetsp:Transcript_7222/g.17946  ORF Transcript_7222/g.17946 Transcript_7222/m.17946 type:complete len:302 (-) Transcript_7222:1530-2435(-)
MVVQRQPRPLVQPQLGKLREPQAVVVQEDELFAALPPERSPLVCRLPVPQHLHLFPAHTRESIMMRDCQNDVRLADDNLTPCACLGVTEQDDEPVLLLLLIDPAGNTRPVEERVEVVHSFWTKQRAHTLLIENTGRAKLSQVQLEKLCKLLSLCLTLWVQRDDRNRSKVGGLALPSCALPSLGCHGSRDALPGNVSASNRANEFDRDLWVSVANVVEVARRDLDQLAITHAPGVEHSLGRRAHLAQIKHGFFPHSVTTTNLCHNLSGTWLPQLCTSSDQHVDAVCILPSMEQILASLDPVP